MKKRLSLLALVLCLIFACTACKNGDEDTKEPTATQKASEKLPLDTDPTTVTDLSTLDTDVEGIDLKDYIVTLGKYNGVEIEIYPTEVTEKEIQDEIDAMLERYPTYEDLDSDKAADGNYVNIDFVGKIDGKEFEGGSAKDTVLLLGSKTYIDGFESGIIGMKKGETKDLKLTFPKDYGNADYAGKDVVFTVTLNRIMKKVETKYTDEFVKENFSKDYKLSTVKEMNEYIKTALLAEKKEKSETGKIISVMEAIVKGSEFKELPQQWINSYYVNEFTYYEEVAAANGTDLQTYLSYYYLTLDVFKKDCLEYATQAVKEDIVLYAIAEAEKMEISDKYYTEQLNEIFKDYTAYYKDVNEFVEKNGGKAEVEKKLLFIKARDFAVDNAKVVGTIKEETENKEENKAEDKTENKGEDKTENKTEDKGEDKTETDADKKATE